MTVTLNGMTLPSWASHVEDKTAPMPLLLVQAFVDTLDRDLGTDVLARPDEARAWLADAGLRPANAGLSPADPGAGAGLRLADAGADARRRTGDTGRRTGNTSRRTGNTSRRTGETDLDLDRTDAGFGDDLRLAVAARESIRTLIGHNNGIPLAPGDLAPLEEILGRSQPRLDVGADGLVRLKPTLPAETLADGLLALLLIIRDAQADGSWDRLKLCANPDCRWAFYDRSHSRRGAWCDMASCGNRLKNRSLRARRAALS